MPPSAAGEMKIWQLSCFVLLMTALTVAAIGQIATMRPSIASPSPIVEANLGVFPRDIPRNVTVLAKSTPAAPPNALIGAAFDAMEQDALARADTNGGLSHGRVLASVDDEDLDDPRWPQREVPGLARDNPTPTPAVFTTTSIDTDAGTGADADANANADASIHDLRYLQYYIYSEVPPPKKPAEIALDALSNIPEGTPVEEIQRVANALGLDPNFMKAVARIESDFDPKQRTGSYIGLFQLSKSEFNAFGSGEITNARDNAVAAAFKFFTEAAMFENATHKKPTFADLYLIHQQGWQGAAEHVSHPDRLAWESMCATDEGMAKGERWCKRAIWGNTLPEVKREWKSVDRLTSGAFTAMWRERIDDFYSRYAQTGVAQAQQQQPTTTAQQ
jgi:hypothetical protein